VTQARSITWEEHAETKRFGMGDTRGGYRSGKSTKEKKIDTGIKQWEAAGRITRRRGKYNMGKKYA